MPNQSDPAQDRVCVICNGLIASQIYFGPQPISNRYLKASNLSEETFPLTLGRCSACGLSQLIEPPSRDALRPRVNWISYREPEGHLDSLVERLVKLPRLDANSKLLGLSYKDDSTLERLRIRGFNSNARLIPEVDLGITSQCFGLESIQSSFTENVCDALVAKYDLSDLIIARHLLEHCQNPRSFLEGLSHLLTARGYLVLEVPDTSKVFATSQYAFVWEEHTMYFIEDTLRTTLTNCGFEIIDFVRYPYQIEDSLVVVARRMSDESLSVKVNHPSRNNSEKKEDYFHTPVDTKADQWRKALPATRSPRLIFGAGHLAIRFLNFYKLSDLFVAVIDDQPEKQGHIMPGSGLPILKSDDRERFGPPGLLLSTLSPESEARVLSKFEFKQETFRSIYENSPRSLLLDGF